MVFYDDKFIFNGIESKDKSVILIDTSGREVLMDYNIVHHFSLDNDFTYGGNIIYREEKETPETITLEFCYIDEYGQPAVMTENVREDLLHWLTEKKFNRFVSYDNTEHIYFLYPTKITTRINAEKKGIITVEYQPYYSYPVEEKEDIIYVNGNTEYIININSKSVDDIIYPVVEISDANGEIIISGRNKESSLGNLKVDMTNVERLYIDNKNFIVKDKIGNNLFYKIKNRDWFRIKRGKNICTLEGNGVVRIKYLVKNNR